MTSAESGRAARTNRSWEIVERLQHAAAQVRVINVDRDGEPSIAAGGGGALRLDTHAGGPSLRQTLILMT